MQLAEQLVGEARERRKRGMDSRELLFAGVSAFAFLCASAAIAVRVPPNRGLDLALLSGLVVGYALVSRVRFEFGDAYVSAEQLVLVPMLLLLPLPYVPLVVACGGLLGTMPEVMRGDWHWQRLVTPLSESWFIVGPVLVIAALAPGAPALANAGVYGLAFLAQLIGDHAYALTREQTLDRGPLWESIQSSIGTAQIDAVLAPLALVITVVAAKSPTALVIIGPLVWLLARFSRDRQARYSAALELQRAYRGTVMLLADVVEFDDSYTAQHSRSVVDLVTAVADELGVDPNSRQELEFAALLHDVGKITIPKETLNKPGRLDPHEFEVMKTHTIEGQFMLDRVGGMLARVGEIVRSCHERFDGNGYPDGLAGNEIPLAARIVFVCDAYNAMTTDRPYRAALGHEEACGELVANSGTQFDPTIVAALVDVLKAGHLPDRTVDDVRAVIATVKLPETIRAAS